MTVNEIEQICRLKQTLDLTGGSRTGLYSAIQKGLFVKPVCISVRAVGWPASEIAQINRARIAGATEAEIRQLVSQLHDARIAERNRKAT